MPAGFHTWTAGEVVTAANVNGFLMNQAVIACTSGARPAGPVAGMTIYQTDNNLYMVYNGTAWVCITPQSNTIATSETTTSATYAALTTPGPIVTVQTNTVAQVTLTGNVTGTAGNQNYMSFAVSGATTAAAVDTTAIINTPSNTTYPLQVSVTYRLTGLTAGSNVFTAQYRVQGGTGVYLNRCMSVVGVP